MFMLPEVWTVYMDESLGGWTPWTPWAPSVTGESLSGDPPPPNVHCQVAACLHQQFYLHMCGNVSRLDTSGSGLNVTPNCLTWPTMFGQLIVEHLHSYEKLSTSLRSPAAGICSS